MFDVVGVRSWLDSVISEAFSCLFHSDSHGVWPPLASAEPLRGREGGGRVEAPASRGVVCLCETGLFVRKLSPGLF